MALLAFGINHTTATLDIRERVAFAPDKIKQALQHAQSQPDINEIAILSTCNRTEIYTHSDLALPSLQAGIQAWLVSQSNINIDDLQRCCYFFHKEDALRHMMKVAGGLDSLVLGEPQILGQMKSAYAVARDAGTVGGQLHNAFQQVFGVAKRVRSQTAIGENSVSVAYTAVTLAQQIFSDLKQDTALLIGAGETIELVARHLHEQGIKQLIVANRTLVRAQALASKFGGEATLLADIPEYLHRADIVISSTASQLPILGKGAVESALKKRKHKPMFMLDIAVPRDIEVEVGELSDVYLYTVDDLHAVIDQNKKSREIAADKAQYIIEQGIESYLLEMRASDAVGVIKAYRKKADTIREQELAKALKSLNAGDDTQQVIAQLARSLTNKLLHGPTVSLRNASADGRGDVVKIAHEIFELTQNDFDKSEQ